MRLVWPLLLTLSSPVTAEGGIEASTVETKEKPVFFSAGYVSVFAPSDADFGFSIATKASGSLDNPAVSPSFITLSTASCILSYFFFIACG